MPSVNDFWHKPTPEALAAEQGVRLPPDLNAVIGQGRDLWDSDEDFDAFLEGIYQRRAQRAPEEKSGAA